MNSWTIIFAPLIDPLLLSAASGLAVIITALLLFLSSPGALLRGLGLGALILALANPSIKMEEREGLPNIALVVTDQSPSQSLADREELVTLSEKAIKQKLGEITNLETRYVPIKPEASEKDGTLVFDAIRRGLSDIPSSRLAGIIVLTDGQIHDAPSLTKDLGIDVPLHAIITGKENEFDRKIEIIQAPKYGIVGADRTLKVKVIENGKSKTGRRFAQIRLHQKDRTDQVRTVRIGEEISLTVHFPHAGQNIVELEIDKEPNEISYANNRMVIRAEGVRENLRVLLVSGEPHAGERTWRNLLKSDAAVDLVHFTILRPPEKQDGTPIHQLSLIAFPTRELFSEKLDDFDLIIFDRYQRRGVLPLHYLDNVSTYVRNGGAVLVAAGEKFAGPRSLFGTPLGEIIPARPTGKLIEQPFRPKVTNKGTKHPVTHKLPQAGDGSKPKWGHWFRLIEAVAPSGDILMEGKAQNPLLLLRRLEKGRIALLLSDHAWLWARGYDGGGPYTTLLRRLAHWLMKEPDLEEEALKAFGEGRNLVIEHRSMKDNLPPLQVTSPNGERQSVTLSEVSDGLWRTVLRNQKIGIHKVRAGELNALAHIGLASAKEMADVTASSKIIAPFVKKSGGGIYWTGDKDNNLEKQLPNVTLLAASKTMSGKNWLGLYDRKAYLVKSVELVPLIKGLLVLALMLTLLGAIWWREGR